MLKLFTIFLFIALITAVPLTSTPTPWTIKDLEVCRKAIENLQINEKCSKNLPPELKHPQDRHNPLEGHPGRCCPFYEAFTCTEQGMLKLDVCKKVWSFFKGPIDEMRHTISASGCHVEKCKKK